MAIIIATGTGVDIASTYGASVNMTAITNATEAVATLAAGHGVVVGDFLEVTSGWQRLTGRIVRVKTVATNDVTLESINTSSTSLFPAGGGTGTVRRITAWQEITQIKEFESSGGEQQYADITALGDVIERKMPTTRDAITMSMTVMDDPALPWYSTVQSADAGGNPVAARLRFPNASRLVANGYWSLQRVPGVSRNEPLTAKIDVALVAEATRYAT